ncbi:MAG TPA: hypothetical protein VFS00_03165, partial [Polyangiaceae bacterium]|nr:hypothetical protein [Polyangiaceae bacterium]
MTAPTMGLARLLLLASTSAFAAGGCSPGPAPVASSPHDPSNPSAPEGVSPIAAASAPAPTPEGEPSRPHEHGHQHGHQQSHQHGHQHAAPGDPNVAGAARATGAAGGAPAEPGAVVYVCPMHP